MTTESVQKRYINDNTNEKPKAHAGKDKPSKLDTDLEIFALREEKDGLKPSVIKSHVSMVRTSLAILAEKNEVNPRRITKADLEFVEKVLNEREYAWPRTFVKVLAKFVSVLTKKEPLVPLGQLGCKVEDALLITPTKTLGTPEDRQRMMSDYGQQIEAFLEAMKDVNFGLKSRKSLCAAIFAFEKVNGKFDPGATTLEDIDRMKLFLKDFGVRNPGKYAALMVRFVSFVTGDPPMREIHPRVATDWMTGLSEQCPFKDMATFAKYLDHRDAEPSHRGAVLMRAKIFGAMLFLRFGVKDLDRVEPEMMDAVCEEISTHVSPTTTRIYRNAFLYYASYFGRDDLRQAFRLTGRRPYIVKDECDAEFKEKLDAWNDYLMQWEFKDQTIVMRLSSAKICYEKLKEVKGPFHLESLDPFDMQVLRNAFIGYSESTVKSYVKTFGLFLDFAIGRNLAGEAHLWYNGETIRRNFVSMEEFQVLWRAGGPTEHMILALGGAMGIRRGEMVEMKLSDFNGPTVTVRGKGAGSEGKIVTMEIPDLVRQALAEYLPYRAGLLAYGDRSDGNLLVNPHARDLGRPMSSRCHQTILNRLSKETGVYFTAHGLRRMYAMNLAEAGVELDTIRRMMRHACLDTTLRCYLQADPRKMKGALNSVNSAFSTLDLNQK